MKKYNHKFLIPVAVTLGILLFHIFLGHRFVDNLQVSPKFFDYRYVVEYARNGWSNPYSAYQFPNHIFQNPYIYGFLVLPFFKFTALVSVPPIIFVSFSFGGFAFFVFYALRNSKFETVAFASLLLVSPPMCLLFQRGNIDLIIILLIIFAGWSLSRGRFFLGMTMVALCCLFKFYLLPAFILLGLFRWRKSVLNLLFVSVVSFLTIINFAVITNSFFPTSWESSFGPGALGALFRMYGFPASAVIASTFTIGLILTIGIFCYRYSVVPHSKAIGLDQWVFLIAACTFIFSIMLVTSFSYRLFLIILTLPFMSAVVTSRFLCSTFTSAAIVGFFFNNPQGFGLHNIHLILILSGISQLALLIAGGILFGLVLCLEGNIRRNFLIR